MTEIALAIFGVVFLGTIVAAALRYTERTRRADTALFDAVATSLVAIASPRGLVVERPTHAHPVVGVVPTPPRMNGVVDGYPVTLAIDGGPHYDGDLRTLLTIGRPRDLSAWPALMCACDAADALGPEASQALSALCAIARRVSVDASGLEAELDVAPQTDANGRTFRVESDAANLEAFLDRGLALARHLGG